MRKTYWLRREQNKKEQIFGVIRMFKYPVYRMDDSIIKGINTIEVAFFKGFTNNFCWVLST